jgi:uncharacterized Zn finger protein
MGTNEVMMAYWQFPKYVTVGKRKRKAENKLKKLMKKNPGMKPVKIVGRAIATTWWGKAWNTNLERYADYANRIGRGRSYVRHSAVLDLQIKPGQVTALVQGSRSKPYAVTVEIKKISRPNWRNIKTACEGKFDSLKKLLSGKFPKALGNIFTQKGKGLFPIPAEIEFSCSCPDWASMCKHVAATLYGIGARLDEDPGLFFKLRNVKVEALVSEAVAESSKYILQKANRKTARVMEATDLSDVFGIDMDESTRVSESKRPVKRELKHRKSRPPAGKRKAGTVRKTASTKDLKAVEQIIRKAPKGITTAELVKKTGLDIARARYFIAQLRKQKRIDTPKRGLYTGVKSGSGKSRLSEMDRVAKIIKRSRKGVSTSILAEKSGLDINRVRYAISRLKAKGKIKAVSRGVYKKA